MNLRAVSYTHLKLGDETVKKLLVQNELLYSTKKRIITKRAEKELDKVNSQLKKLWTQPCKCKADAEQELNKITAKLKLVKLTDAGIEMCIRDRF